MSISREKNQSSPSTQTTGTGKNGISEYIILENRHHFNLHHAFILLGGKQYRLIVCRGEQILKDKIFRTLRGAKIAFAKLYGKRAHTKALKILWSTGIQGDLKELDPPLPLELLGLT